MVDTCGHGRIISESNDEETIRECKWFWGVHYLDKMGATQITDICGSPPVSSQCVKINHYDRFVLADVYTDDILNRWMQLRDDCQKKKMASGQYITLYDVGPIMGRLLSRFWNRHFAQRPWESQTSIPMLTRFFFYHRLCRPASVDSQSPILNSRDAKCRWNDCTRRGTFYFVWISSSSRREQSTSRSQVIVCYRRLRVSLKFLCGLLSKCNMSCALGTHRRCSTNAHVIRDIKKKKKKRTSQQFLLCKCYNAFIQMSLC